MALEPTQASMASGSDASEASGSLARSASGPRAKKSHKSSSSIRMLLSPDSSLAPRSPPTTAETHEHAGQTASPSLGSASTSLSRSQSHTTSTTTSAATAPSAQSASSAPHPALHTVPPASTQRSIAEARAAVVADMGNMLDIKLQGRAGVLHANAAAIARQERDVERALDGLRRDGDRLARLASETASRVKEVGNVQNFAEMMERDFLIVEDTLRRARARAERAAEAGGGDGRGRDEDGSDNGSSWTGSDGASWQSSASREGSVLGDGGSGGREVVGDGSTGTRGPVESLAGNGKGILASSANGRVKVVTEPVM